MAAHAGHTIQGSTLRRVLLVNPSSQKLGWIRRFQLPPLALLQVAASTPDGWDVAICDETVERLPDLGSFDLIGITAMTHQARRAYAIADEARASGIPVVLGGIHPTVLPHEAGPHADAVVIGEAEPVWAGLLGDISDGRLAPVYSTPEPTGDVLRVPWPRRAALEGRPYLTRQTLQASRGCPYDCPFCTVTPTFGRRFRYREAEDVLAEVRSLPGKLVVFLDDNLLGDRSRALPLLQGLAGLDKRWAAQVTLAFAEDAELLRLVARSGCLGLFVGVEGLSGASAHLAKRRSRVPQADLVRRVQDAGVLVEVSLIFGFDDQDEGVFDEAVRFVDECGPCGATFHILTPYPGTAFFRQFEAEGRLLHKDWPRYNHNEVVYRPAGMSPERLYRGSVEAKKAVYSWPSLLSRVARNPHHRLANLAYNVFRRAPNTGLDPDGPPEDA